LEVVMMSERKQLSSSRLPFSTRAAPWLWGLAVLDMTAVAWMIVAGSWLDHASWFTRAMTLNGRHVLVLALASVAFVMLAGLAVVTHGFAYATRPQLVVIALACVISVVALAGAMSAILLLVTGATVLGVMLRPLKRL
jgi:hypothetical protein